MWVVNSMKRAQKEEDPEFCPFPSESEEYKEEKRKKVGKNPLANKAMIFQFVKSPISVNPGMVSSLTKRIIFMLPVKNSFHFRRNRNTSTYKERTGST
jgi:hypothetical protein